MTGYKDSVTIHKEAHATTTPERRSKVPATSPSNTHEHRKLEVRWGKYKYDSRLFDLFIMRITKDIDRNLIENAAP